MKEIKIIVDGEEIPVQISEENLEALMSQPKLTGFERVSLRTPYYLVNSSSNKALRVCEDNDRYDTRNWDNANYYSDNRVADWCGKADLLMRRIRRYAALRNVHVKQRTISYVLWLKANGTFGITDEPRYPFTPVFYSLEGASAALDVFGDESKELYDNCPRCI